MEVNQVNKFEQLNSEMNPDTNSLIPNSPASKRAIREMENADPSKHGENIRNMRPESNPLIIGADIDTDPNNDPHGIRTLDGADPNENYVWSEKSGLYFKGDKLNGR